MPNPASSYQTVVGVQPTPSLALTGNQQSNMANQMQGMMVQYPPMQSYQVLDWLISLLSLSCHKTESEEGIRLNRCWLWSSGDGFDLFYFVVCAAGFCSAADVPAASVCVLPAGTGGGGCVWHAALLQPAPHQPAHHHEVLPTKTPVDRWFNKKISHHGVAFCLNIWLKFKLVTKLTFDGVFLLFASMWMFSIPKKQFKSAERCFYTPERPNKSEWIPKALQRYKVVSVHDEGGKKPPSSWRTATVGS